MSNPGKQEAAPVTSLSAPTVAVVGIGYVGLPLALEFARSGCTVVALDVDSSKVEKLRAGESYVKYVDTSDLARLVESRLLFPSVDFRELRKAQAILICVPTPISDSREPDLQYVIKTAQTIKENLGRGQLVVLESTTYPGTTEEVVLPILEESGLRCPPGGEEIEEGAADFFLAFSPERVDPGNRSRPLRDIPKIIGGINPPSTKRAQQLYQRVFDSTIVVSSTRAAEMTKLLENIYRAVNIALVNELKLVCQRMGIDIWEVIDAAATKPFGFTPFYPGPGLGGHCIPIDPFYLAWKVRQYDMTTRFIELAGEINTAMPSHVAQTVVEALNARGQTTKGAQVLILGVAYKKDIDDMRESPALKIIQLLGERGADVQYNDPHVPRLPRTRRHDFSHLQSVALDYRRLGEYDCVVVVTDHSDYNFEEIVKHSKLVVDTRNATRRAPQARSKVVRC